MVSPFSIATTGSTFATALAAGCGCCAASGSAQASSDKRIIRFMKFLQRGSDDAVGNRVTGGGHSEDSGQGAADSGQVAKIYLMWSATIVRATVFLVNQNLRFPQP